MSSETLPSLVFPHTPLAIAIDAAPPNQLREVVKQACLKSEAIGIIFSELLHLPERATPAASKRNLAALNGEDPHSASASVEDGLPDGDTRRGKKRKMTEEAEPLDINGQNTPGTVERVAAASDGQTKSHYAICDQCNQDFDEMENHDEACQWHSGKLFLSSFQSTSTVASFPSRKGGILGILPYRAGMPAALHSYDLTHARLLGELEADYDGSIWDDHDERIHGAIDELQNEVPEGFLWSCCEEDGESIGCEKGRHNRGGDEWRTPHADLRAAGFPN